MVQCTGPADGTIYRTGRRDNLPDRQTVQSTGPVDSTIYWIGTRYNLPDRQMV